MNIKFATLRPGRGALIGLLLPLLPAVAAAVDVSSLENVLEISGGGSVSTKGDKAAFQKRHQIDPDGFGGIGRLYYTSTTDAGTLTIEGRALAGNEDYLLSIKFENEERGWLSAGYREFRTWYDGTGGVIPMAATRTGGRTFITLGDEAFAIDRTQFWAEGLFKATPNLDVHFKYTRNERDGQKDSTSQADTNLTGGLGGRRIIPSFYDINESQNLFELDATLRTDTSEFVGAVRWDNRNIDNARNMRRRAFEAGQDRSITHRETTDSDLFNVRAYSRHHYSDNLVLNAAYSHSELDTVMGGSRIIGSDFNAAWNPLFANRQFRDEGFFDLSGDTETELDVANINIVYTPKPYLAIIPSFRFERENRKMVSEFTETNINSARVAELDDIEIDSERDWDEWFVGTEVRYTGLKNFVLIGRVSWSQGDGEINEDQIEVELDESLIRRDSLVHKWTQKHSVTANWYPTPKASFSALYTYWNRLTDYDTLDTSKIQTLASGDRFPAFIKSLEFTTDDLALRMTLRPRSDLTLVSRYDYQMTDSDSNSIGLQLARASDYKSEIYSQSASWSPNSRIYIQGTVNYVQDKLKTPASDATGAAARVVLDQVNDYWTAIISTGIAVDEQTDVQLQYNYFFADNFVDNSDKSVPYGLDRRDQSLSATLVRKIGDRTKISLRYAWAKNDEDSSLGLNDFEAHLIYGKVEYRF